MYVVLATANRYIDQTVIFLAVTVYRGVMHKLVSESYLKPSTILSHVSPTDKQIKYEGEEKQKLSGFPTAKELKQAKQVAEIRLRKEEGEEGKVGLVSRFNTSGEGGVGATAERKGRNRRWLTTQSTGRGNGNRKNLTKLLM
jgi:hypothetical protein